MAYIVQNSEKNYAGNSSSVDALIPDVDVQIGDYIVFYGTINNGITWSSAGYTNAGAFAGGNVGSSWLYKKVTALPEPNPTITMSASQVYALVGFVVRDADPTTFLDDVGVNGYSTNTTSLQIPSVTAGNKSLLVTGVSSRGATARLFSQDLMNVSYPNGYLLVSSGYQESAGATPTIDITQLLNDRGAASIIAIKNKTGGAGGVSISGGPTYFMRGLDGLTGPTSLDTRRATINGKTVGTTVNMSVSNSGSTGSAESDFFTSTGISLNVSAGGSGVAGEQNGVVFNVPAGHDFSSDSLMFNYFLNSLDNNFQDDVAIYLEDGSGNWVVRRLYDQEDTNDILETYTHYGQFETNTDAYPIEDSSGVMDYSDVQWWGLTWENKITNTGNRNHNLYNFGSANNPLVFVGGGPSSILNDGGSINPRTITKGLASGSKRRAMAFSGLGQDVISESVQIGDGVTSTHYYAPFTNLEMQQRGGFKGFGFRREDRTMEFRIKTSASDVIDLSSSTVSTPNPQDFILDPTCSLSATYDFNGFTLSGFYVGWLAGLTCNNASFIGGYDIDGKSGTFDGCTFASSKGTGSAILITAGASVTNCSFLKGSETYAIEMDVAGAYNLSETTFSGYTKDLNVTAGSGTVTIILVASDNIPTFDTAGATVVFQIAGVVEVVDGTTYTTNADKFLVDTDTVASFTIDGFIPTQIEHTGSGSTTIFGTDNAKLVGTTINGVLGSGQYVDGSSTLVLGDGLNPSVNWVENIGAETLTLANATTETDLLGLRGLEGVDYEQNGGLFIYTTDLRVDIAGTLDHEPSSEILILGYNDTEKTPASNKNPLTVSGTYNYGNGNSFEGGTVYDFGTGLQILGSYFVSGDTNLRQYQWSSLISGIYVSATGTFNWTGASIYSGRSIISEGAMNITDGVFTPKASSTLLKDYCPRIGFASGTGGVDGLEVFGSLGNFFGITLGDVVPTVFQNVNIVGNTTLASAINPEKINAEFSEIFAKVTDIPSLAEGNLYSSRAWQRRLINWENYGGGVNLKDELADKTTSTNGAQGAVHVTKKLVVSCKDVGGANLQDVKVYIPEVSDTNEPNNAVTSVYTAEDITYLEAPVIHLESTDVSGNTPELTLNLFFGYKQVQASSMIENVRTKGGLNELDVTCMSYNDLILQTVADVSGTGVKTLPVTLTTDATVTETTKATVDAYTTVNTAQQFYDRAKAYLVDNYAGESSTLVSRNGEIINAGSYDVVIDGAGVTAPNAFTVVGNTMTIHASIFTGGIATTGTITVTNDALLDGGIF